MINISEHLPLLPFWKELNEKQRQFIRDNAQTAHFEKGSIPGAGSCLGMIYIISGGIRTYILSEEGREISLFRVSEGETCVLSASCVISQITFETGMIAETDCDVLLIGSAAFDKLTTENIYVKCFMYELLTERFSTVMWVLQQILFKKFDSRLADFFIKEYERTGNPEICMTHEQIATEVNSAREVVARMIKRFVSDGLVDVKRGKVILKNVGQLKKITDYR